jgi:hypothetical protein
MIDSGDAPYRKGFWHGALTVIALSVLCSLPSLYSVVKERWFPHHAIDAFEVGLHPGRFDGKDLSVCGHVAVIKRRANGYSFILCDRGARLWIKGKGQLVDTKDDRVEDGEFVTVEGVYSRRRASSRAIDGTISAEAVYDIEDLRMVLDQE